MAVLYLLALTCDKTQEAIDEPYLRAVADGRNLGTVWGPRSMDDGESVAIGRQIQFNETVHIELWEKDRGRDDLIRTLSLTPGNAGSETGSSLRGRLARYTLRYQVAADSREDTFLIRLLQLKCNDAQELTDEIYLTVNGEKVWGPTAMRTGQIRGLDRKEVRFSGRVSLQLWEYDSARSDPFYTITVSGDREAGRGPQELRLWLSLLALGDAEYTLTYEIERRPS